MSENPVTSVVEESISSPSSEMTNHTPSVDPDVSTPFNWPEISRTILKKNRPLNPLTTLPDELEKEGYLCFLSLSPSPIPHNHQPEAFFTALFSRKITTSSSSPYRIAFVGETGTGKTLLFQRLAIWLLENNQGIPLLVRANDLQNCSLEEYISQKWLSQVATLINEDSHQLTAKWRNLIQEGQLWLLLDGMDHPVLLDSKTPTLLGRILRELEHWGKSVNIVLNCRKSTWKSHLSQGLNQDIGEFDCYYTRELQYPLEVNRFIQAWFEEDTKSDDQNKGQKRGNDLIKAIYNLDSCLSQTLLSNPLRLSLICRWWQQQGDVFPHTLADIYEILVQEYYQWKAETLNLTVKRQKKLNQWLAQSAYTALKTPIIPNKWIFKPEEDGASPSSTDIQTDEKVSFRLKDTLEIGWLNRLSSEQYEFNDGTFAAYFAAQKIPDYSFFLSQESPNLDKKETDAYSPPRFFNPHYHLVLFFWFSRSDIPDGEKDSLIEKFMTFPNYTLAERELFNPFRQIAYFLAGSSLAHFPQSSFVTEMISQLVSWALTPDENNLFLAEAARLCLGESHRKSVINTIIKQFIPSTPPQERLEGWKWLEKKVIHQEVAIMALTDLLENSTDQDLRTSAAECLGKIAPHHPLAVSIFINLLAQKQEEAKITALKGLAKIGQENVGAILALIKFIAQPQESALKRRAFQCLEMIGQNHELAIAALTQLIRHTNDSNFRRMAAECLEKIDRSHPVALGVLIRLLEQGESEEVRRMAVYSLGEVEPGNPVVIEGLVKRLKETDDVLTQWVAVSSLGKVGRNVETSELNLAAVDALVKLIESGEGLLLRREALESLGKIEATHPTVISTLGSWVQVGNDESLRREAAEYLGRLDPGNPEAIAALAHLLQTADDSFTRRQAATSLGRIDSGNLEAITSLLQLIKTSQDPDIQCLAIDSLGELGANNPAVIATLIRLLKSTQDKDTFQRTIRSLGKIGLGNREVVGTVLDLLFLPNQDEGLRVELADCLMQILLPTQIPQVVTRCADFLTNSPDCLEDICQPLLWYCAQHLSYREFYQAWYQHLGTVSTRKPMLTKTEPNLKADHWLETLKTQLKTASNLKNTLKLVLLDCGEFLDLSNPVVDIYDQMLAQACPEFPYGMPETPSKLRFYWQWLERNEADRRFFFLFYGNSVSDPALNSFWQLLSKFHSRVAVIGHLSLESLTPFDPDDPQLVQIILNWVTESLKTS